MDLELFEVKNHLRATELRFVDKSAPDLESKPPPALSVEAGPSAKHKEVQDLPEMMTGSDQFPRGQNGEGRQVWYGKEGDRAELLRLPMSGDSSRADTNEFRLQVLARGPSAHVCEHALARTCCAACGEPPRHVNPCFRWWC